MLYGFEKKTTNKHNTEEAKKKHNYHPDTPRAPKSHLPIHLRNLLFTLSHGQKSQLYFPLKSWLLNDRIRISWFMKYIPVWLDLPFVCTFWCLFTRKIYKKAIWSTYLLNSQLVFSPNIYPKKLCGSLSGWGLCQLIEVVVCPYHWFCYDTLARWQCFDC